MTVMIVNRPPFIPILLEETDKIMKAQMSARRDLKGGNIIQNCKNMVPLLVPLFISALPPLQMIRRERWKHAATMEGEGRTR